MPITVNLISHPLSDAGNNENGIGPYQVGTNDYVAIIDFIHDPEGAATVFLAAWRSLDGGLTWSQSDATHAPQLTGTAGTGQVYGADIDPASGKIVVAYFSHSGTTINVTTFNPATNLWGEPGYAFEADCFDSPTVFVKVRDELSFTYSPIADYKIFFYCMAAGAAYIVVAHSDGPSLSAIGYYNGTSWSGSFPDGGAFFTAIPDSTRSFLHVFTGSGTDFNKLEHTAWTAGTAGATFEVADWNTSSPFPVFDRAQTTGWISRGCAFIAFGNVYVAGLSSDSTNSHIYLMYGTDISTPAMIYSTQTISTPGSGTFALNNILMMFDGTTFSIVFGSGDPLTANTYLVNSTDGTTFTVNPTAISPLASVYAQGTSPRDYFASAGMILSRSPNLAPGIGVPYYMVSGGSPPPPTPTIGCNDPPTATIGTPYSHTFSFSGGTPPYTFAITSGSLPPGLSLNTSTGVVSGTPSGAGITCASIVHYDASTFNDSGAAVATLWESGLARGVGELVSMMIRLGGCLIWARGNGTLNVIAWGPDHQQSQNPPLMIVQGVPALLTPRPGVTYQTRFDMRQIENATMQVGTNAVDEWVEVSMLQPLWKPDLFNR
jgi:hypothetical protein